MKVKWHILTGKTIVASVLYALFTYSMHKEWRWGEAIIFGILLMVLLYFFDRPKEA